MSLDWEYEELPAFSVDDYETVRSKTRRTKLYQLVLSYYRRHEILQNLGFEEHQLKVASRQVARAQRQRSTTRFFLPVSKVEEIAESAGRKVKRARSKTGSASAGTGDADAAAAPTGGGNGRRNRHGLRPNNDFFNAQ